MFSPERFPRVQTSAVASGTWFGPTVTASGSIHTKGSYTSLIAATNFHAFMCGVIIGETAVATTDTSMLVDIAADPAGGTSYTVEIPNILAGGAPTGQGPRTLWFPCSIPRGSQVAARCQALIASDTVRVGVVLLGGKNEANPFPHRGGIQDYGTNTGTSGGTAMANSGSVDTKGAYTQLGADTTRRHSGLVVAAMPADSAVVNNRYLLDIGMDPAGGTSYGVIIPDMFIQFASSEQSWDCSWLTGLLSIDIPAGAALAARAAGQAANEGTNIEVAVYAF